MKRYSVDIPDGALLLCQGGKPAYQRALSKRLKGWSPDAFGTLVFVTNESKVLLINKKTGHGAGKINVPGGKVELGESPVNCATREVREEVGLAVDDLVLKGEMKFVGRLSANWQGYVYTTERFCGDMRVTEEAEPFWCSIDEVPFASMWRHDSLWWPYILFAEKKREIGDSRLYGEFLLEEDKIYSYRCYADTLR
tara:strand:- start:1248 stop:1835 length:588 start_codon:yes stop_codon:yes gene_type:complete